MLYLCYYYGSFSYVVKLEILLHLFLFLKLMTEQNC